MFDRRDRQPDDDPRGRRPGEGQEPGKARKPGERRDSDEPSEDDQTSIEELLETAGDGLAEAIEEEQRREEESSGIVVQRRDGDNVDLGATIDLLHHARQGDKKAWEILYDRFYGFLRTIVAAEAGVWLLQKEEVDDLGMQALEDVMMGLPRVEYRGHKEFIGWLRRVAKTTVLKRAEHYRRKKRPPRFETLAKGDDSGPGVRESQVMGFGDTPSTIISRRESFDRLLRRVGELRASDQEFVRLYLVFAGNMRAIAASLGITQANARMRWVRLRRKLGDDDDDEQSGAA